MRTISDPHAIQGGKSAPCTEIFTKSGKSYLDCGGVSIQSRQLIH